MGSLIYSAIASLDGYVEDASGQFDWAAPDEQVHSFLNDLERPVGAHLLGRRMYETMIDWNTVPVDEGEPVIRRDFARMWQAAEKVVYSRTLESVSGARTRLERSFDTEAVRHLKSTTSHDLTVGGADLASQALKAELVDELQLFAVPVVVGGGKAWLPKSLHLKLDLLDWRTFDSGVVFLRYRHKVG